MGVELLICAKLFQHGRSQAVRLPKEFRFEGTEVFVRRMGDEVILSSKPKASMRNTGSQRNLRALETFLSPLTLMESRELGGLAAVQRSTPNANGKLAIPSTVDSVTSPATYAPL